MQNKSQLNCKIWGFWYTTWFYNLRSSQRHKICFVLTFLTVKWSVKTTVTAENPPITFIAYYCINLNILTIVSLRYVSISKSEFLTHHDEAFTSNYNNHTKTRPVVFLNLWIAAPQGLWDHRCVQFQIHWSPVSQSHINEA